MVLWRALAGVVAVCHVLAWGAGAVPTTATTHSHERVPAWAIDQLLDHYHAMEEPVRGVVELNTTAAARPLELDPMEVALFVAASPAACDIAKSVLGREGVVEDIVAHEGDQLRAVLSAFNTAAVVRNAIKHPTPDQLACATQLVQMLDAEGTRRTASSQAAVDGVALLEVATTGAGGGKQKLSAILFMTGLGLYAAGCRDTVTNEQLTLIRQGSMTMKIFDILCNIFFWGRWFRAVSDFLCWDPQHLPVDCLPTEEGKALRGQMFKNALSSTQNYVTGSGEPKKFTDPADAQKQTASASKAAVGDSAGDSAGGEQGGDTDGGTDATDAE